MNNQTGNPMQLPSNEQTDPVSRLPQQRHLNYMSQMGIYLYHQMSRWWEGFKQRFSARSPTVLPLVKLDMSKSYRVELGRPDRVAILLVGCGGSGSFAAHILAQYADWANRTGVDVRLYFIDPDKVEEKNLVRQNFCRAEIGYPKAVTLAWRYTAAFGLNIVPIVDCFSARMLDKFKPSNSIHGTVTVVVGAVDNFRARRDIADAVTDRLTGNLTFTAPRDRIWWIDAGNERFSGQILAGNSLDSEPLLSPLGFCTGVPLPHIQDPTLLQERERQGIDNLSCADLTLLEEQSAMINRTMATWVGIYLYRLLQSRDLRMMATHINLDVGATRSTLITTGRLVKPALAQRPAVQRTQAHPLEDGEAPNDNACPVCGSEVIEGTVQQRGVLIGVRFCSQCTWREEGCPECGHEIGDIQLENDDHQIVPALGCVNCGWSHAIPEQFWDEALAEEEVQPIHTE